MTERDLKQRATAMLPVLSRAARAAGEAASRHYQRGANTTARVTYKKGGSPVTEADFDADRAIRAVISAEMPEAAIFSEEAPGDRARFAGGPVVVVDPIDGTRAFMQGRDEWCVSIALMTEGRPLAGVIHAPARGETYEASAGGGARLNGAPLSRADDEPDGEILMAGPKFLLDRIMGRVEGLRAAPPLRALAYRLAAVSSGAFSAAIASEGAHDWDIAAADVILAETGCVLLTSSGERPVYNAVDPVHPALVAATERIARRLLAGLSAAARP
jgi:myo-inositol-1(or 4)-monophosphatase